MALRPKLMADGAAGKVAVFMVDDSTPRDRTLLDDPESDLSKVLFHSDLLYPIITTKVTGTLNLPSRGSGQNNSVVPHNLFAHGLAGQPLVFGRLTNVGNGTLPLAGSIPIQANQYGFARWLSVGADETNVRIAEQWITHEDSGISSTSVDWEVWVTNLFVDQENPLPEPTGSLLHIDGTSFQAGRGKFDTTNRYLRTAVTNAEFAVIRGHSLELDEDPFSGTESFWRYSVAGYVQQQTHIDQGNLGDTPRDLLSFDADYVLARTE